MCLKMGLSMQGTPPQSPRHRAKRGGGFDVDADGDVSDIDLDAEEQTGKLLVQMIALGTVTAAHDISDGGLAIAIAEMCINSSFGAHITPPIDGNLHGWAFGEDQARYVVTTADGAALTKAAQKIGIAISKIGTVTSKTELQFGDDDTISIVELRNVSEACLPNLMSGLKTPSRKHR